MHDERKREKERHHHQFRRRHVELKDPQTGILPGASREELSYPDQPHHSRRPQKHRDGAPRLGRRLKACGKEVDDTEKEDSAAEEKGLPGIRRP